jgi:hypothetical protein
MHCNRGCSTSYQSTYSSLRRLGNASVIPGKSNTIQLFFTPPLFGHPIGLKFITRQTLQRLVLARGEHFIPRKAALCRMHNITVDGRIDRWWRDNQGSTIQIALGNERE